MPFLSIEVYICVTPQLFSFPVGKTVLFDGLFDEVKFICIELFTVDIVSNQFYRFQTSLARN